jgi:hypothetical protein
MWGKQLLSVVWWVLTFLGQNISILLLISACPLEAGETLECHLSTRFSFFVPGCLSQVKSFFLFFFFSCLFYKGHNYVIWVFTWQSYFVPLAVTLVPRLWVVGKSLLQNTMKGPRDGNVLMCKGLKMKFLREFFSFLKFGFYVEYQLWKELQLSTAKLSNPRRKFQNLSPNVGLSESARCGQQYLVSQ